LPLFQTPPADGFINSPFLYLDLHFQHIRIDEPLVNPFAEHLIRPCEKRFVGFDDQPILERPRRLWQCHRSKPERRWCA
jgi:hypothetical protein